MDYDYDSEGHIRAANLDNVKFINVKRDRPIVLTGHEVFTLSRAVGRDVHAELLAICGERYEAATLGQLMRTLQEKLTRERVHISSEDCWCGPTVEFRFPSGTPAIWVHKQVQ